MNSETVCLLCRPRFEVCSLPCSANFTIQNHPNNIEILGLLPFTFWLLHSAQFSSVFQSCPTLRPHGLQHARPTCPSLTPGVYSDSSPLSRWCPSNYLILCCPLLLLPSVFPGFRVFSNELALHIRWWKFWSFSFSISLSNEHAGLISFSMDWLNLLAVQGSLKSLL